MERRFGNTAAITNVLLERLRKAARFGEGDGDKLQAFTDVCADLDSQLDFLPGLGCLNYLTAIGPIVENLPNSLHSKWEKRVVNYVDKHHDAYPGFKDFAAMVKEQARLRNHRNVLAGTQSSSHRKKTREHRPCPAYSPGEDMEPRRVLKTNTASPENRNIPYCHFHQRKAHFLAECIAFENEPLKAKNECILRAGLCFCCLSQGHRSGECSAVIKCAKCGLT